MIVHRPTMKLLQVTELTEQVVTFNICAVKAAEKVAIDNADDVPAEQAVPGEPEQDDEATINVKQSDNETFQNSNTDEELPSVVDFYESKVNNKEISPFIHTPYLYLKCHYQTLRSPMKVVLSGGL